MDLTAEDSAKYFVPSDKLKELNDAIAASKGLANHIAKGVQFRVVVDSNVVVGDILWLTRKRAVPGARTSLIETIEAGTVEAYVPSTLFTEVEEHLYRLSIEEGISHDGLTEQWTAYQKHLKVLDVDITLVEAYREDIDPDDAFFIVLAQMVAAAGIVSNDRHIKQMGGHQISVYCIVSLRDYSRAKAVELHIKFAGFSLGLISAVAFIGLFHAVKTLVVGIQRAPDWVKIALILAAVICVFHPESRRRVASLMKRALEGIKAASPKIAEHIAEAAAVAETNKKLAERHLEKALRELEQENVAEDKDDENAPPKSRMRSKDEEEA